MGHRQQLEDISAQLLLFESSLRGKEKQLQDTLCRKDQVRQNKYLRNVSLSNLTEPFKNYLCILQVILKQQRVIKRLLKKCYSGDFSAATAALSSQSGGAAAPGGSSSGAVGPSASADLVHIQSLSLGSSDGGSDSAGDTTRNKGGAGGGKEGSSAGEYDAQNDSDSAIMLEDHLTEV